MTINQNNKKKTGRPIKVVQFGEGNFLRAFVDYMIDIANKKSSWIDFNAGKLLDGVDSEQLSEEFLDYICDLVSGKIAAKSEKLSKNEIAIFKDGVTL